MGESFVTNGCVSEEMHTPPFSEAVEAGLDLQSEGSLAETDYTRPGAPK